MIELDGNLDGLGYSKKWISSTKQKGAVAGEV